MKKNAKSIPINKKSGKGFSQVRDLDKYLKSIKIFKKTIYFYENSYKTWLYNFSSIKCSNETYELCFNEEDIDSCLLGQGGNGFVFKYRNADQNFAIKFLVNEDNKNNEVKKLKEINSLFEGEKSSDYRVTRYINDGQCSLTLFGISYDLYFIIMDLADGTIKDLMCDHFKLHEGNLETSELLSQIKHLSETVNILHDKNFAHRDIKPENILMKGNFPVLADFGLSGKSNENVRQKGPKYWPNPEFTQACDSSLQKIDDKSDIFNLGCLFFYFFTKKYPIGFINIEEELKSTSTEITNVIMKMLSYDKENRLNSISELLSIVESKISR